MDTKINPVRTLLFSLLYFWATLLPLGIYSQSSQSLFDIIYEADSVDVTIETNFKSLLKKKDEYQDAKILIKSPGLVLLDTMGEVRTRGNARKAICYMPPTKLRVSKKHLENKGLSTYPTLKVVNSCSFSDLAESYLRLEHFIYEVYNVLTERSFRSKFLNLRYIDSEGKKNPVEFEGFLIEHEDQMAARMNGEIFSPSFFKPELLERESYLLFCMFQYMIGNTDWKVLNKHNLEIIKVSEERKLYPVAYDFDYSGVVHTSYAVPNERTPLKNVTERFYLGPCQTDDEITTMQRLFSDKKQAIMSLVTTCLKDEKQQKVCGNYIQQFYDIIEDDKWSKQVFSNCIDY
ncbi:MAG: hypothetical protein HKN76_16765 [Saprospiraceae bacterium]|nr:hypothetical protein [Saprospiraceae bacterium]